MAFKMAMARTIAMDMEPIVQVYILILVPLNGKIYA